MDSKMSNKFIMSELDETHLLIDTTRVQEVQETLQNIIEENTYAVNQWFVSIKFDSPIYLQIPEQSEFLLLIVIWIVLNASLFVWKLLAKPNSRWLFPPSQQWACCFESRVKVHVLQARE